MIQPPLQLQLRPHFVAFLDILGFKEMVESDLKGPEQKNLAKLFRCHQSAGVIFRDNVGCTITQFSDSIVVSMPYEPDQFEWFVSKVAEYQRLLLDEQLLCRGGIAIDKHFSNGTFTFSAGLIAAYMVESKLARYPRVVISQEALELIYPDERRLPKFLIEEDDGLVFVDYLGLTRNKGRKSLTAAIEGVVDTLLNHPASTVREKGLWLGAYSDAVLGTQIGIPRFVGHNIGFG